MTLAALCRAMSNNSSECARFAHRTGKTLRIFPATHTKALDDKFIVHLDT